MSYNAEQVRAEIAKVMSEHEIADHSIRNEMPAMERILADRSGYEMPEYTRNNKPDRQTYLGGYGINKPSTANALLGNLSQRVNKGLSPAAPLIMGESPMKTTAAIAVGAQSIDKVKNFYDALGLLDGFYQNDDVVENRYAVSAAMYAEFLLEQQSGGNGDQSGGQSGETIEVDSNSQGHGDEAALKAFAEWVQTLEPYMRILSRYIDKTIGAPTERVKRTKVQDDEGDEIDIVDLDIMQANRMTSDSLVTFASNRAWAAINLDELTMEERYTTMTKKYIDVFVVDNSGSMDGQRIFRAAAYLYNRLDKVEKGWAMLAVIEFDTSAKTYLIPNELAGDKPRWLIDTPAKARWAKKNIIARYANFVGGGTSIPAGVREGLLLSKKMEEHYGGHLPNITVITDDDYSIGSMNPSDTNKIPVNGLAIKNNSTLQNFCIKTGGTYYNLDEIELNVSNIKRQTGE